MDDSTEPVFDPSRGMVRRLLTREYFKAQSALQPQESLYILATNPISHEKRWLCVGSPLVYITYLDGLDKLGFTSIDFFALRG